MKPRLPLDTHILIRLLPTPKRLSRNQSRALEAAVRNGGMLAFSAVTLLEIAYLSGDGRIALTTLLSQFFSDIGANPAFLVLPPTFEIALDASHPAILRDPMDRAIVATARVHGLTLVTSGQRICVTLMPNTQSGLVASIE